MARPRAILLVGPSGSGKTPLGELLGRQGFEGRRCHHFDFGERLRLVAAGGAEASGFNADEIALILGVLSEGALLEDEHFHLARRMLEAFLVECAVGPEELLVMNGLPRHEGQAREIEGIVEIGLVINLKCSAEDVLVRIGSDVGGDRAGRQDNDEASVRERLAAFHERTEPLVERYRSTGVRVEEVEIGPRSTATDVMNRIEGPK